MSDRKYPDVDFVETDTETIESNLIALYENFVQQVPGRERYKVYPASPERLFISWVANIIVQQRVIINETAKRTCHDMRTVNTWTAWQNYSRIWKDYQQVRRPQCSAFTYHRRRHNQ